MEFGVVDAVSSIKVTQMAAYSADLPIVRRSTNAQDCPHCGHCLEPVAGSLRDVKRTLGGATRDSVVLRSASERLNGLPRC